MNPVLQTLLHDSLVLFAMVNAVGNLPLFADMTAGMTRQERRKAFDTAVLTAGSIVLGFALVGRWMLDSVFEVDTGSFKVAGGLLVFFVAARGMLLGPQKLASTHPDPHSNAGIFPMGFPFLAGPGTIVTTILLMQHSGHLMTAAAAIIVYLVVRPLLEVTNLIQLVIGKVGVLVVARILYIFIAAKAVTFVITGLKTCMAAG